VYPGSFDARRLRALLAAERIARKRFAAACDLDPVYVSQLLTGRRNPGELALIKIEHGLRALGLDHSATEGSHAS